MTSGGLYLAEITAPELLGMLRRIENRGALDTAHRAQQNCGQIFRYGVATGRCDRDPAGDLRGALAPAKQEHFASITEPVAAGELLRANDAPLWLARQFAGYSFQPQTIRADSAMAE